MPKRITPEQAKQAYEAYNRLGGLKEAAAELGTSMSSISRRVKAYEQNAPHVEPPEQDEPVNQTEVMRLEERVRELSRELKAARKHHLTDEEVRRFILGSRANVEEVPEWVPCQRNDYEDGEDIPMAQWSDFHWAEVVAPEEVLGLNEFNMEIAQHRLKLLTSNTIYLLTRHLREREWPGIVINLNGDMLSGDIHDELSQTNAVPIMPAFLDLRRNLTAALKLMADQFGRVFVPCEWGNHTRTNRKPQHKQQAYRNFDWLLYQDLADFFADDPRVKFVIGSGADVQYRVHNHRYRLTHGNQFGGGQGFVGPLAPITRGELKKRITAESQGHNYDTLLIGHWHRCMWHQHVIVNGSLKGYDEYAIGKNFEFEYPKQMLWLNNSKFGPVSPMEVWCVEPRFLEHNPDDGWVGWKEDQ